VADWALIVPCLFWGRLGAHLLPLLSQGLRPLLLVGFSLISLAIVQTSYTAAVLCGHLWTAIVNPNS
jgi:hypothetical protein